jgi:lipoprotein signal peptidase
MTSTADRSYRWLFWCLALLGFAVDQWSKYAVFNGLYRGQPVGEVALIPNAFYLHTQYKNERDPGDQPLSWLRQLNGEMLPHVNTGALFGLGGAKGTEPDSQEGPTLKGNTFFALVSVGAAVAIMFWVSRGPTGRDRFLCLALGLILAGTLGNLFDRVVFSGVRDFLYWKYVVDWPVFNIADCCLVCGASLLLVQAFLSTPEATTPEVSEVVSQPQIAEVK